LRRVFLLPFGDQTPSFEEEFLECRPRRTNEFARAQRHVPNSAAEVGRVAKGTAGDCRSARDHHGAGTRPPPLFKTVSDMTVGLREFVIEAPRRDDFTGMPTEARPAAFRGEDDLGGEGNSILSSEI
jgi:hypothetical protein